MNRIVESMLNQYNAVNPVDRKNIMKEIIQEITLCGLSRAGLFKRAAFYGGTALRIFHGLDRFSEDLDFSLKAYDPQFDLGDYMPILEKEIKSYGLNFKTEIKTKSTDSGIKSAFIKGNTKEHMMMFYPDDRLHGSIGSGELIKIKLEVDTDPPDGATTESRFRLLPIPYEVLLYDIPSLFAGKIHAIICRGWENRIKGRDLYDFVFYLSSGAKVNLRHLNARLGKSCKHPVDGEKTLDEIKGMLCERFNVIDFIQAKQDVLPFVRRPDALDIWKTEFFCDITKSLHESV